MILLVIYGWLLKDKSSYAILDKTGVKVNQQTYSLACYSEIGQNLRFKYRIETFNTFDFHYYQIFHQQIETVLA